MTDANFLFGRIEQTQRAAARQSDVICFAGGLPDSNAFPREALTRSFLRVMNDPRAASLQYGWPEGQPELRALVAGRLRRRGCNVEDDEVLITSGAQQAIAIAVQLIFQKSKSIAVDPETYSGALDLFRTRQLDIGVDPERAAGAYVMPQIANPRGNVMDDARRRQLTKAARDGLLVIEDDAYADIYFEAEPRRPLRAEIPESTFYIGTFSKSLCPGFRVGWLVPPARFLADALAAKRESDLQANSLSQAILADFLVHEDFDRGLEVARRIYRRRANCLTRALRSELPSWKFEPPAGGFSIWVETGEGGSDVSFLEHAVANQVSFDPGSMFQVESSGCLCLRLSFSFLPQQAIVEGVRRLAATWRQHTRGARSRKPTPSRLARVVHKC